MDIMQSGKQCLSWFSNEAYADTYTRDRRFRVAAKAPAGINDSDPLKGGCQACTVTVKLKGLHTLMQLSYLEPEVNSLNSHHKPWVKRLPMALFFWPRGLHALWIGPASPFEYAHLLSDQVLAPATSMRVWVSCCSESVHEHQSEPAAYSQPGVAQNAEHWIGEPRCSDVAYTAKPELCQDIRRCQVRVLAHTPAIFKLQVHTDQTWIQQSAAGIL